MLTSGAASTSSSGAAAKSLPDAAPLAASEPVRGVQYAEAVPFQQQQQQQYIPSATIVHVVHQAGAPVMVDFGAHPTRVVCPSCHCDVVTNVQARPSLQAHVWALGLCVFGCWPCCVVPYFVNECQAHVHSCPNCGRDLGVEGGGF